MKCLHCEISELMMRRQGEGEQPSEAMIGNVCQVIADVAASQPDQAAQLRILECAVLHLSRFAGEIIDGTYGADKQINDPNNMRQRQRH